MRIKICGLTRMEDAQLAQSLGAWGLGFIFYPGSKRYIDAGRAKKIISGMTAPCIGVFVNQMPDVKAVADKAGLQGIQLHGDETPAECAALRREFSGTIIKALRPGSVTKVQDLQAYKDSVDYILLDAAATGEYGGSGQVADWDFARQAVAAGLPIILAGGISAGNIADAQRQVAPFAVDLASSVESAPGIKDENKLEDLFRNARNAA